MFSNQTSNYGLPQYEQNDTLNVLSDFNGAMETIDSTMKTNELAAASAQNKADGADTKANNNATAITDLQTAQGADRTDINTLTGAVNTINSLIGNGEPTTTDKTIIGAINEINADLGTDEGVLTAIKAVTDAVSGNYVISHHGLVTVTADGVKTRQQLLNELMTAFGAEVAALDTTQVEIASYYDTLAGVFGPTGTGAIKFPKATPTDTASFGRTADTGTGILLYNITLSTTAANCSYEEVVITKADGSISIASQLLDVPADGAVFGINYTAYKAV